MPKASTSQYATAVSTFAALSKTDQVRLFSRIRKQLHGSATIDLGSLAKQVKEKRFSRGFYCPHCKAEKVVRNGSQNGHQTFVCRACDKYFSEHTNTPMRGLRDPEKWLEFVECELMGYALRKSAVTLGIALSTAWAWRRKLLAALQRIDPVVLRGILETDETYIRENQKGNTNIAHRKAYKRGSPASKRGISKEQVCVVVLRDRTGSTRCQVAGLGPITKAKAESLLAGAIDDVTCLCSDANGAWRASAAEVGLDHKELNQSKEVRTKGIYHIQNVNSFHSRFKDWLRDFRGVASKYLDSYAALFRFIDAHSGESISTIAVNLIVQACLTITPERYPDLKAPELLIPA